MNRNSAMENMGTSKDKLMKAEVYFDANEYINLMRKKSPESLKPEPDGKFIIDAKVGEEIFYNTQRKLNLTPEEMKGYVIDLETEIRRILSKQN